MNANVILGKVESNIWIVLAILLLILAVLTFKVGMF